jgi:hypothetical protein
MACAWPNVSNSKSIITSLESPTGRKTWCRRTPAFSRPTGSLSKACFQPV